ncbi:MAG: hypothetical protein IKU30_00725 [Clostridia bacterium]|nr:hypothetical protein [Clostridia bacterium]
MGRGSSGRRGVIVVENAFNSTTGESGTGGKKWTYPGIDEQVTKLEKKVESVKSSRQVSALQRSIDAQDNIIGKELDAIKRGTENGDEKALMAYRRRLRTARKALISKEIL